jgi:hypothetical protein
MRMEIELPESWGGLLDVFGAGLLAVGTGICITALVTDSIVGAIVGAGVFLSGSLFLGRS